MSTNKSNNSVLKKDPLPVIEVPSKEEKKVVLVKESSTEETTPEQPKQSTEMEVDNSYDDNEDVISPGNQM